jgi:hypothetical protein
LKRAAAALFAATTSVVVHAGRPLTTEDASVVPDKACQLEAWVDRSREATQGWLAPACNFGANIEWQAGFARTHVGGDGYYSGSYLQAKALLRPLAPDAFAFAVIVGANRFPAQEAHRGYENAYVIVPVTMQMGEATLAHLNLGWARDRLLDRDATLWGAAIEHAMSPRWAVLAEAFGENAGRPFLRIGGRATAITNRLDIDVSVVARPGGTRAERFVSLGFHWQTDAFLP